MNYLQKAWGDSIDDASIEDIKTAITEIQEMDDERAAFWVGILNEDESILEINKDLSLIAVFEDDPDTEINVKCRSWKEVEELYALFLNEEFETVKTRLAGME